MDPAPFLRGVAYPPTRSVAYPRAKPGDTRIPGDTWYTATFPIGVRLELSGDAAEIEISYECRGHDLTWTGDARRTFEAWRGGERLGIVEADEAGGTVRLPLGGPTVIYLPERLAPRVISIEATGGTIEPPPAGPRWLCYGDSIAAGQRSSSAALGWAALVAREHDLDLVNLGYSGAARGELVSAEQLAELDADVISMAYGTNCWNRVPHTEGMLREGMLAFLRVVRAGHPATPIVVASAPLRPEAEETANAVGATLADLRRGAADAVKEFADERVRYVDGRALITEAMLDDDVHPNDAGHRALADALGPIIAEAARGA